MVAVRTWKSHIAVLADNWFSVLILDKIQKHSSVNGISDWRSESNGSPENPDRDFDPIPFLILNDNIHENLFFQVYELLNDIRNHKYTLNELDTSQFRFFRLSMIIILNKVLPLD